MTNIEQFTAPGKYYIDKFFEEVKSMLNTPKSIGNYEIFEKFKNKNHQLKQNYNRMQN